MASASSLMFHRGPDDAGLYSAGEATFAFRRLAIIDLSPAGHQPMLSRDGTAVLVFNGEIYNYRELREDLKHDYPFFSQTDSEVLLNGYQAWGWEELLRRIDGMFAFAIWDSTARRLHIARDRVGKKPLVYKETREGFLFASTLNALIALNGHTPPLDSHAIDAYLTYQAVPAPSTVFRGVRQLPPAHWLTFDAATRKLNVQRYWNIRYGEKLHLLEPDLLADLDTLVQRAVRSRLMSDVRLGAFLSGGVDSSLVTAVMARELREPVEAVVMGFADAAFDERRHARTAAAHLGVNLYEHELPVNALSALPEIIWHYGQPFADVSMVPTYFVAKHAREHVTVVLNGDGGDELFGGYARPLLARAAAPYRRLLPAALRRCIGAWMPVAENGLWRKAGLLAKAGRYDDYRAFPYARGFGDCRTTAYTDAFRREVSTASPAEHYRSVWEQSDGLDDVDRVLYLDFNTYLPDQLLTKMDISTMAHGVEARSPLLSRELIEFAARIPTHLRLRGFTTKYLLKKLAARYVPPAIVYRKKRGFVMPAAGWIRSELAATVKSVLLSSSFRQRDWIKTDAVAQMIAQHCSHENNWTEQLWTLFVLELWARVALDKSITRDTPLEAVA